MQQGRRVKRRAPWVLRCLKSELEIGVKAKWIFPTSVSWCGRLALHNIGLQTNRSTPQSSINRIAIAERASLEEVNRLSLSSDGNIYSCDERTAMSSDTSENTIWFSFSSTLPYVYLMLTGGVAMTGRMRFIISPGQWQPYVVVSALLGTISMT